MLPACYSVCGSVLLQSWISPEKMPSVVEERGKERRARETPEQREARLYQRRLRDRERAYFHFYALPSCLIDAKSSQ